MGGQPATGTPTGDRPAVTDEVPQPRGAFHVVVPGQLIQYDDDNSYADYQYYYPVPDSIALPMIAAWEKQMAVEAPTQIDHWGKVSEGGYDFWVAYDAQGNIVGTPHLLGATPDPRLTEAELRTYEAQYENIMSQIEDRQRQDEISEYQQEQIRLAEEQLAWEKERYGLPGVMSEYEKEALRLREEEGARSYELDQKRYELDAQELEWRMAQDGELTAWQEEQLGLARQELEAQAEQQAWQRDISEQELKWQQQQFYEQMGFEREQFAWQQEETRRQAEVEQRNYLAQLAAQPHSWLEFSLAAGKPAVVQPFMLPLATEQYPELQAGQVIPGWPTQAMQPTQPAYTAPAYPTGAPTYPTGYTQQPALPTEAEMWATPPQTQQYVGSTPLGISADDWAYRQSKVSDWAAKWVAARSGQSIEEARADLAAGLSGPEFGGPSVLHELRGEPQELRGFEGGISDPMEIAQLAAELKRKAREAGIGVYPAPGVDIYGRRV